MPEEIPFVGDKGIKLIDVYNGKNSIEEFISQLTVEELACIVRGEGMNSPKVTPGTGAAFGGLTKRLNYFGIPICCATDGPAGLRLDSGAKATKLPIGTMIASTFNPNLTEELFNAKAVELYGYDIDALLGPGMNIHRHPLNGRNFEYFSEDPYLTGVIAAAIAKGISVYKATATIKHFCCNNQETARYDAESIVSERALREIYLRPFEFVVKEGYVKAVMTTYNPVNGSWTAGSYDLNTTILRNEWGFEGIVMTDWWAKINNGGEEASKSNTKAMLVAQNDINMVNRDALSNSGEDNTIAAIKNGKLTIAQLQRSVKNILKFVMKSQSFGKFAENGCSFKKEEYIDFSKLTKVFECANVKNGKDISTRIEKSGTFYVKTVYRVSAPETHQFSVMTVFANGNSASCDTINGTNNRELEIKKELRLAKAHSVKFEFDKAVEIVRFEMYK